MTKYIIGNLKMYLDNQEQVNDLVKAVGNLDENFSKQIVICPPFPFIAEVNKIKTGQKIQIGAQDLSRSNELASTGDVSAKMLANLGAEYVIVGHSERRAMGENSEIIKQKLVNALENGLIPIYCVGDNEEDSEKAISFIQNQIENELFSFHPSLINRFIIAYEPIWAIGEKAKREASPGECENMIMFIKNLVQDYGGQPLAVLYGGSVNENNVADYIEKGRADGVLVGRASSDPVKFINLINAIK